MSGARWSTAEGKPRFWAKWLARWHTKKRNELVGRTEMQEYPLVLIGLFETRDEYARAAQAFAAAGFDEAELASVCHPRSANVLSRFSQPRTLTYLKSLLASGGACVLVLSVVRFSQACQIIEQAGGWIGAVR
ncbi:MAG TPA: hypothetical protein VJN64_06220 [Terriglobales bacterium]|nr:hypothetical protein [Terriglobales bacterium]